MKITHITLEDFAYFKLERIKRLSIDFKNNLQIILGSNGSGKSKLMRELIFLVSPLDSFYPDGSKTINIEHNGSRYTLVTKNSKKEAHSFIKDGVELNDGHTATVQKELVQKEFGLTPRIQNILSRSSSFCKMTGSEMMDLLIEVSGIDFKYTDAVLASMNDSKKQTLAQLKYIDGMYTDLFNELRSLRFSDKVSNPDYVNALNILSENLNGVITPAVDEPATPSVSARLKDIMKTFSSKLKVLSLHSSIDNARLYAVDIDKKLAVAENVYNTAMDAYFDVEQLRRETALWGGKDIIVSKIKQNESLLVDFVDDTSEEYLQEQIVKAKRVLDVIAEIRVCLEDLDAPVERSVAVESNGRLNIVNAEISSLGRIHGELSDKLNIANDGSFTCKNCGKNSEVSDKEKCASERRLADIKAMLVDLQIEQSALEKIVGTHRQYIKYSEQFVNNTHPGYHWIDVSLLRDPNNTVHLKIEEDISVCVKKIKQIKAMKENVVLNGILSRHASVNDDGQSSTTLHLHDSLEEINQLKREKAALINALEMYDEIGVLLKEHFNAIESFKVALRKKADTDFLNAQADIRRGIIKELGNIYSAESRISAVEDQLKTYEKEKVVRLEKIENINLLLQVLSKREGVAANNLKLFMTEFFGAVNRYVSLIMKSDIVICFDEDVDKLSFKFPLIVNGEKAGDLTTASSGQKDAIDTAVMLVILECLDFKDYPIFLDEVGSTFDNANRDSLIRFISEIANGQDVSQVFLISHFSSMYSNLANCDITVIHEDNLVDLPLGFNGNVIKE